jgi:hypothetical protein
MPLAASAAEDAPCRLTPYGVDNHIPLLPVKPSTRCLALWLFLRYFELPSKIAFVFVVQLQYRQIRRLFLYHGNPL